jgi:sec-independent protein translocase protein TatC
MANSPHEPDSPEPEEEGGPVKTFLEHLEDLRWTIIKCLVALVVGMGVCMAAAPAIIEVLKYPLLISDTDIKLEWLNPLGGVGSTMRVALYGGITLALPFILYFIAEFVLPALKKTEKKYFIRAFIVGGGLFMAGVMLCYFFILEISLGGLVKFNSWLGIPTTIWRAEDYFSFVVMFMMGMGLSFEFPVILLTLVRLEIISHQTMVNGRRYFLLGNFVLCAFITPDFISTFFMVIPVQLLMEVCILISAYWERKKRAAEKTLAAAESQAQPAARD